MLSAKVRVLRGQADPYVGGDAEMAVSALRSIVGKHTPTGFTSNLGGIGLARDSYFNIANQP